jgi:para-aminobenzoate synthetase component 1
MELICGGESKSFNGDPLSVLEDELASRRLAYGGQLPFVGGAVGYFSYDLGRLTEGIRFHGRDDVGMPDLEFGFYDTVLLCDNLDGRKYIASVGGIEKAEEFKALLKRKPALKEPAAVRQTTPQLTSNFTKEDYLAAVEKVRDYIRAGDTYQVNLSQRFTADFADDAWTLYKRLRKINPAPFAAYLNFGDAKILSSSPERFLKVRDGVLETRPIKGTRPRGRTKREDEALARELSSSEKDKAEHVMIVDLERNDLGKVSEYGSVQVAEMEVIESYATVHHMVSTVRGRLRKNASLIDCIRATFPGGSITGAPKVRAMEIIDELEPTRRGLYTGSIGYLGFNGVCDLNIVIRTMLIKDGRLHFHVGGGVVYDSDPEAEYQETLDKAKALFESLLL